jgi:hypothetical protein
VEPNEKSVWSLEMLHRLTQNETVAVFLLPADAGVRLRYAESAELNRRLRLI